MYSVKPNLTKTELDLNIDPLTGMGGLSFYKPSRNRRHADAAMYYDRLLGAHDAPTTQLRDARRLIRAKRTSEPNYMRDNDTMINEYYSSRSEEEDQLSLEVESGYSSRCGIGTKIGEFAESENVNNTIRRRCSFEWCRRKYSTCSMNKMISSRLTPYSMNKMISSRLTPYSMNKMLSSRLTPYSMNKMFPLD